MYDVFLIIVVNCDFVAIMLTVLKDMMNWNVLEMTVLFLGKCDLDPLIPPLTRQLLCEVSKLAY